MARFTQKEIGYCQECSSPLSLAEPFEDEYIELDGKWHGRYCKDYGYAVCQNCGKRNVIDDSFRGNPYYK